MTSGRKIMIPLFDQLPTLPDTEERHAWNVWEPQDQLGTVNLIGSEQRRFAASLVQTGEIVLLSLPLDQPAPGLFTARTPPVHTLSHAGHGRDDHLDGFFLQFSSQWDGLRHVRYRQHGFWGGRQDVDIDDGGLLGVEHWARHGLISRGVLIDTCNYFSRRGDPILPSESRTIDPTDLDAILADEGVELRPGDIVLIRTGWLEWYLDLEPGERQHLLGTVGREPEPLACPGLHAGRATAGWLWDHRVAAVAADNPTLEALPVDRNVGFLHYRLLPLLGMPIGEYWPLAELSIECRRTGRFAFMLFSGVLNLTGGVGSPNNAYAVF